MDYKSLIAKAYGLGSAHDGTKHWLIQRITAIALIPLTFWIIALLKLCITAPYLQTVLWLSSPINSTCIVAWILIVFYHTALGLEVVIEDYVAHKGVKIALVWTMKLALLWFAIEVLLAVLHIILVGGII